MIKTRFKKKRIALLTITSSAQQDRIHFYMLVSLHLTLQLFKYNSPHDQV